MKAVFLSPIVPSDTGNGLAMRMGMFVQAMASIADVDVIVVPVAGGQATVSPLLKRLRVHVQFLELAGRSETHFALLSRIANEQARLEAFRTYGKPSLSSALSASVLSDLAKAIALSQPDLVHIGRSYLAPCVAAISPTTVKTIDLDEDDLGAFTSQAKLFHQRGENQRAAWLEQEGRACDALVGRFGSQFQRHFVSSQHDARSLAARHPDRQFTIVENAVAIPPRVPHLAGDATLTFVGSLSYAPNADGILWFCREVLPRLRATRGSAFRLLIAGSAPPPAVAALDRHPRVHLLGYVPDIAAIYRRSSLALAPLRAGGGTRIKLMEAAAHCVASVSTPVGAQGLAWPQVQQVGSPRHRNALRWHVVKRWRTPLNGRTAPCVAMNGFGAIMIGRNL